MTTITTNARREPRQGSRVSWLAGKWRLLDADWRNASWMIKRSPKSLRESLDNEKFRFWLLRVAGTQAESALAMFSLLPTEAQQTMAYLVRRWRSKRKVPGWAANYWRATP